MEDSTQSNGAKIEDTNEKIVSDFSIKFNAIDCNCTLIEIENKYLKIKASFDNEKYEAEYSLNDFLNMNRNFRIYDELSELVNDLVSYIKQDKMRIISIQDNKLIFELTIVAKSNNIIILELNKIEEIKKDDEIENNDISDNNNNDADYIIEELKIKNEEIRVLKNKLKQIQDENKKNLVSKDNIIDNLKTKIEELEIKFNKIKEEEVSVYNYTGKNNNLIQKYFKLNNIMQLQKEYKTIKTKKPVNEICVFPETGNYIESSGPKIYDKEHNLLMSLDDIGYCDHMCILSESSVILTQKNIIILLRIINYLQNSYGYEYLNNNNLNCGNITKIIKDSKDGHLIASDDAGIIYFLEMTFSFKANLRIRHTINTNYKCNLNLFLFKEYLFIAMDDLYYIKREEAENYKEINSNDNKLHIKPSSWNSIISIDENEKWNLIGVGCESYLYILKIDESGKPTIKYTYKISNESSYIDALCLYQNKFLLVGTKTGDLYFYTCSRGCCEHKKTMEKVHKYNKDSDTAISGINEFPDGSFATYGGDNKIKIWYI